MEYGPWYSGRTFTETWVVVVYTSAVRVRLRPGNPALEYYSMPRLSVLAMLMCVFVMALAVVDVGAGASNSSLEVTFDHCPECSWPLEKLIEKDGYVLEKYWIRTEDGFVLQVFRIPYGRHESDAPRKPRPAVFLQHGLMFSAGCWTLNGAKASLAYVLADAGYDVWLGNDRGNKYSPPSCRSQKCWQFSFDEIAKYDIPAYVNFVVETTGVEGIAFIGHSEGGTAMLAHLADCVDLVTRRRINLFVALAPGAYAFNISAKLLRFLADIRIFDFFRITGGTSFGSHHAFYEKAVEVLCEPFSFEQTACEFSLLAMVGSDDTTPNHNINATRLPLYANMYPQTTSLQNMVHWTQLVVNDKFQKFDYGWVGNEAHYGQLSPPTYDLSRVDIPIALFTGTTDALADATDIQRLVNEIPAKSLVFWKHIPEYNHLDLILGMSARDMVFDDVLVLLQQYSPRASKEVEAF